MTSTQSDSTSPVAYLLIPIGMIAAVTMPLWYSLPLIVGLTLFARFVLGAK